MKLRETCRRLRTALLLALLAMPAAAVPVGPGVPTNDFLRAREAHARGDDGALERAARGVKDAELAPYLDYFRLSVRLRSTPTSVIEAFLETHAGTLVADRLRGEWLKQLAVSERWDDFGRHWPALITRDDELQCAKLRHALASGNVRDADARRVLGELGDLASGCSEVFADLLGRGQLDAEDVWQRLRNLPTSRRSRPLIDTAALLPAAERPGEADLRAVVERPVFYLSGRRAIHASRLDRELALLAIARLAVDQPAQAADQMLRLENQLSLAEQGHAWAHIAWRAAQQHLPEAGAWYENTRGAGLTDEQWQWWARAALRAENWETLRRVIESMPARIAQQPTWVYWLGRAYLAAASDDQARALFARIAGQSHFYGNLASEELGRPVTLPHASSPPTLAELNAVGKLPGLRLSLALFAAGARSEAVAEWNWTLGGMSDRQLLAAAELARRESIYDRAIGTANQTRREHDYALRYLSPFEDKARPLARERNVDEAWVYGLMRQESRFISDARSPVGASGLMQLMPGTAQWVARKTGMRDFRQQRINDPEMNLMLGTSYLRLVLEDLDNHPVLASAAYNAGPSRARAWRDPRRVLEGAIYAETIPFAETREYVKKVMSNALYYNLLFTGDAGSLKTRLGGISPASAAAAGSDLP